MAEQMASTNIIEVPKAGWVLRLGAYLIDAVAAIAAGLIAHALIKVGNAGLLVTELFFLFNFIIGWARGGQTIGMKLLHIRVVMCSGKPVGWVSSIWRYIAFAISLATGIGMILILFTSQRQGLHDFLADTFVIKTR